MENAKRIDLHMHSANSDGSESTLQLLGQLFVTGHFKTGQRWALQNRPN